MTNSKYMTIEEREREMDRVVPDDIGCKLCIAGKLNFCALIGAGVEHWPSEGIECPFEDDK